MHNDIASRSRTIMVASMLLMGSSVAAFASVPAGGIDTPTGTTTLPLSVQGVQGCELIGGTDAHGQPTTPNFGCSGFLGIGTSTPTYPLEIDAATLPSQAQAMLISGNTTNGGVGVVIKNEVTGGNTWSLVSEGGSSAPAGSFGIYDNGLPGERLVISNKTGNVGIGTPSPQATLDVNGETRVGSSGAVCSSTNEGALQYDKTDHVMKYCNGTSWLNLSTPPSTRYVYSPIGNLMNDGAAAYCNSNEYVVSGGGYCNGSNAALIWSAAFHAGDDIWNGYQATADGWRADCNSPGGVVVPATAFVVCAPK